MTTETIEKTRIPGVPDKALVKAASLANTNSRISWSLWNTENLEINLEDNYFYIKIFGWDCFVKNSDADGFGGVSLVSPESKFYDFGFV